MYRQYRVVYVDGRYGEVCSYYGFDGVVTVEVRVVDELLVGDFGFGIEGGEVCGFFGFGGVVVVCVLFDDWVFVQEWSVVLVVFVSEVWVDGMGYVVGQ